MYEVLAAMKPKEARSEPLGHAGYQTLKGLSQSSASPIGFLERRVPH